MTYSKRTIGTLQVSPIGMGAAHWSIWPDADYDEGTRAFNAGVDAGITFVDTALRYTNASEDNHNEKLIAKAIRDHKWESSTASAEIVVATKGGHYGRGPDAKWDTSPEGILKHCELSLQALQVDSIDLYYLHWPREQEVPISETMRAFQQLREEGKIKNVGVSNFDKRQLDEAMQVTNVDAVQNLFNPNKQTQEQFQMINYTSELGIAYVPYSSLGGTFPPKPLVSADLRLEEIAKDLGVTVPVLTLDWHLNLSPNIIPLVGSRRASSIMDSGKILSVDIPESVTQEVATIYGALANI
jgi:aryl-alcohol dehydrogenase-like predicted oxidoreductase